MKFAPKFPGFSESAPRFLERQAVEDENAADGDEGPAEPFGGIDAVGAAGGGEGEQGGAFAGAGDLGTADLLHALGKQLRGALVEHEAIDQAELNAQEEDDQSGQEVLIAVKFHAISLARRLGATVRDCRLIVVSNASGR